jgi:TAP-like protein
VLVTNNLHDPATPLIGALAVWRQIPEAALLTADADGHQARPVSRCAFEAQRRFLDDPASTPRFTGCAG